ncbi:CotS family spore coat protein [Dehalobacterium formicoaceticum]|uniref:CotS family spore coat protein n=1 Tax=Dehalobacterium formicoaceticum TaxID=51515 RepID=A0ABT1Y429_9FIRM|nr:CotS family spore coat protein [Dehalobacterium formicoaceticum]MCR6545318.1 CotS family spore coat protein [Dehalobacterium formicoaceticum]
MKGILSVLSHYDFSIHCIIPIQDDVYRVETSRGVYCLKCANKGEHKMLFIYSILKHLEEQGFTKVSFPVPAKDGSPLVHHDHKIYFMTHWISGIPCDFKREDHLTAAAETLAEFHQHAKGAKLLEGAKARAMYRKWPHVLQKRTEDLQKFKSLTQKKSSLTPFEKKYLAIADQVIAQGGKACATLQSSEYRKIAKKAEKEQSFTHRDVAARNFIIEDDKKAALIDFDYARYDIRAADVVRLLERSLRDQHWHEEKGDLILKSYQKVYPLEKEQYQVMLAFLQFPQKIWRISERYFEGKVSWQDEGFLKKLSSALRKMSYQEKFCHSFENKYCQARKGG